MEEKKVKSQTRGGRGGRGRGAMREKREEEYEQSIVDLARVTRVMAGGKRMRFRACIVIGDRKGTVGMGLGKGADVTLAINKAMNHAKKNLIHVSIVNDTIAHDVSSKFKAALVLLRKAEQGKGIVAGGAMRQVLELSGIPNVVGKILGSSNKINTVRATMNALQRLKHVNTVKTDVKTVVSDTVQEEQKAS